MLLEDGLVTTGIGELPIAWEWRSSISGPFGGTRYFRTHDLDALAATAPSAARFEALGFARLPRSSARLRVTCDQDGPLYSLSIRLLMRRADVILDVDAAVGGVLDKRDLSELVRDPAADLDTGRLLSALDIVPMGKGQTKAVKARALDVLHAAPDVRSDVESIEIFYATRAGKHGRIGKTASRRFTLRELSLPENVFAVDYGEHFVRKTGTLYEVGTIDNSSEPETFTPRITLPPWWSRKQQYLYRCADCGTDNPRARGLLNFAYSCCGSQKDSLFIRIDYATGAEVIGARRTGFIEPS